MTHRAYPTSSKGVVYAKMNGTLLDLVVAKIIGRYKRLLVCLDNSLIANGLNETPLKLPVFEAFIPTLQHLYAILRYRDEL